MRTIGVVDTAIKFLARRLKLCAAPASSVYERLLPATQHLTQKYMLEARRVGT